MVPTTYQGNQETPLKNKHFMVFVGKFYGLFAKDACKMMSLFLLLGGVWHTNASRERHMLV